MKLRNLAAASLLGFTCVLLTSRTAHSEISLSNLCSTLSATLKQYGIGCSLPNPSTSSGFNLGITGNFSSTNTHSTNPDSIALEGDSTNSLGVYGYSANYVGVYGFSPKYVAVWGYSPTGYSAYFGGGFQGSGSCYYAGGPGWNCPSDRNLKENFTVVDVEQILQRLSQLPITRWNMKGDKKIVQHIGPTSQDFHSAFAIGDDDKHINTADIQGVALAAIKGLYQVVQQKDIRLQKQEAKLQEQEVKIAQLQKQGAEIAQLQKQMDVLKAQLTTKATVAKTF